MNIYQIEPISDPRWADLVQRHSASSVFHTVGWLEALKRTYDYEPVVFTTSSPTGALENGVVFCRVKSWFTGARLVSLPFSDHCEPLCDSPEDLNFILRYLQTAVEREGWKYVEVRSSGSMLGQTSETNDGPRPASYFLHVLDLHSDLNDVFRGLDRDSVQRRIQHANRSNLEERSGTSDDLLRKFYGLFVMTRHRHRLPPPPYSWFKNLLHYTGDAAEIRIACEGETPIAAILTLRFRDVLYYKYGCSDPRFKRLGATPWLLWNAVAAARSTGATAFDMGRTQQQHTGLLAFKNRWVKHPQRLAYWSFPTVSAFAPVDGWHSEIARRLFSCMPSKLLALTGRMIYRHIG